jgi:hypothetical protein
MERGGQRREIEKRDREARACPRRRKQRRDFASRQGSEQRSKKRRRFLIGLPFLFDTQLRLTPNQQAPAPFSPSECDVLIDRCASRGQQEQKAERIWQLRAWKSHANEVSPACADLSTKKRRGRFRRLCSFSFACFSFGQRPKGAHCGGPIAVQILCDRYERAHPGVC